MTGYLAVGHGRRPNGTYDPGAVGKQGQHEHILADRVAAAASAVLQAGGEPHVTEIDGGVGHDPNYVGSTKRVNDMKAAWAIEVHFDWNGAPPGGFGLYVSDRGKALADQISDEWSDATLATRGNQKRSDLYFLKQTTPPAIIWECGPVGAYSDEQLTKMGQAIGNGILAWLGKEKPDGHVQVSQPQPPAPPPPTMSTYTQRVKELQRLLGVNDDGVFGPKTTAACNANLIGWEDEVRRRNGRFINMPGNDKPGLVAWLQSQGARFGYPCAVDGAPGPQTNHLIVVILRQGDGICGPNGFHNACRDAGTFV